MSKSVEEIPLFATTHVNCGSEFILGNDLKDTTFHPGSVGYMSFALGDDYTCPNVMFYNTVIIRRGQKGKWRVEKNMLLAPIFLLPGVPLNFIIPENNERKHFVDMQPIITKTTNLANSGNHDTMYDLKRTYQFLAYTLAKGLFFQKLDSATKPIKHPLIRELTGDGNLSPIQKIFSTKNGPSRLIELVNNVESLVRSNDQDHLNDLFWNTSAQRTLLKELRAAEVRLTLPALEYNKKVNEKLQSAIKYIIEKLNTKEGKALANHKTLLASANATEKDITDKILYTDKRITSRLEHIVKNRKLVGISPKKINPFKSDFSTKGKDTHVFSSNQSEGNN